MKLTLPPRVSAADFQRALQAFEGVVGKGWVLATDEDRDAYSDIYAPGPETEWPASAAVAPGSVEEVQALALRLWESAGPRPGKPSPGASGNDPAR